jgi:hypothetical protein
LSQPASHSRPKRSRPPQLPSIGRRPTSTPGTLGSTLGSECNFRGMISPFRMSSRFPLQPSPYCAANFLLEGIASYHASLLRRCPDLVPFLARDGSPQPSGIDLRSLLRAVSQADIPGILIEQVIWASQDTPVIATPSIVSQVTHHAGTDRVQFNVPTAHDQLFIPAYDRAFEATFP